MLFLHRIMLCIACTQEGAICHLYTRGCIILFLHRRVLYIACAQEGAVFHLYTGGGCCISLLHTSALDTLRELHALCVHCAKFQYMCFHGHCFPPASKLKGTKLWYGGLCWGACN